jgi:hypothetical protein
VNAAITVALAAAGQTSASAATSATADSQLAAIQAALSNWFATLAVGVETGSLPGAQRLAAIDQVLSGWA